MSAPKFTPVPVGRAFILEGYGCGFSPAMQALHEHACGWLQTVDGLSNEYEYANGELLPRRDAILAADRGFRGDSPIRARAMLAQAVAK